MITKNRGGMFMGALIGTMLGSAGALLYPKRQELVSMMKDKTKVLANKTKEFSEIYNGLMKANHRQPPMPTEHFFKGTLLGLLCGAGSALLLSPKSGKQLRHDLTATYQNMAGKTQKAIDYVNHHPKLKTAIKKAIVPATAKKKTPARAKKTTASRKKKAA